ncbi:aminotransferase class V-fold PLP-dependent enzyme [Streptomyces sp. HNM0574]|uniref:pyridoxal phosphate-dependent decarboxylase family protein n=1 Tax=Streptomyces sp. HNM0574 TaxID=2714954 RepID=UPI00146C5C33|nr:aminotransferase class V-fold PLP-dependent enzyme [Streptomyces sp. HNM0574]NLU67550.1 aminotransferase class V-fold PLP-dependent enzyme [Streptomyces sp. HNM0574]
MCASSVEGSCLPAGGVEGPAALRPLTEAVLGALASGAVERGGPLPAGGPERVRRAVRGVVGPAVPEWGVGAEAALRDLVGVLAAGAADPADPLCAAHLHCPPLAVAAAADLAVSALNPSMDSWDQAPAASELEAVTCRELAGRVFAGRGSSGAGGGVPDALVTTGGTESNQLGVLLAREVLGPEVRVVCGEFAHHSVHRAAWLLGLRAPVVVPSPAGVLEASALERVLSELVPESGAAGPRVLVVATAGTTDTGAVDPLAEVAAVVRRFGVRLHVDAAYGGSLLFSERLRGLLAGVECADSVTLDLHKLGWQPVAAGLFVVPEGGALRPLDHRADYLNADDDTEAGLPDLLGRSLRTTRRPDVVKVAVTLRALGWRGLGALVERTCGLAEEFADLVAKDARFELFGRPGLSTVLFRPVGAGAGVVAQVRRSLLASGSAALGRAEVGGGLWLKATLLNPWSRVADLSGLLELVAGAVPSRPGAWSGAGCGAGAGEGSAGS